MFNRIERGAAVRTQDGEFGHVHQVIVDPDSNELTHVVVRSTSGGDDLMVPATMIAEADAGSVMLNTDQDSLLSRSSELRYNESDFQPVDPDQIENRGHAPTGQTVTEADNSTLEFGGTENMDSGAGMTATTLTEDTGYQDTGYTDMSSGQSQPQGAGQQRKGGDLAKLDVITFAEGEKLGKPKDILFDPEQNRIIALLMSEGGWFSSARVIPWQNIKTIGHDSIIVPDRTAEIKADSDPYIKRILEADNVLTGTEVYTEDGRDLGRINDMYVEDNTGEVIGYEVTGGMFQALAKGKKFMPAPDTITMGQDAAFVPNEVGDAMQAQTGGIAGTAQGLGSSASGALSTAKEKVTTATTEQQRSFVLGKSTRSDVTSDTGEVLVPAGKTVDQLDVERAESAGKLNALFLAAGGGAAGGLLDTVKSKTSELTDRASTAVADRRSQQLDSAIGRTVGRDVYADDGTPIALQGTVVDPMTVERARSYGKENQLLTAVGAASTQATVDQAREGLAGAFSGVKAKIDEISTQQREKNEQRRLDNALGRPVTRVILDRQDNVILDTAQIVTNQAIEQARMAGVLDILLDSVYTGEPEFSNEALHSGKSGQASLNSSFEQKRKPGDPIT